ncbi:hypothetical protein ACWD6P_09530 [Streptomyces sp. NPDC002446]
MNEPEERSKPLRWLGTALDTGKELTWQSVTLTGISFAITVAATFTGYYKFRERSYFLQQTADAIEQEAGQGDWCAASYAFRMAAGMRPRSGTS